MIALFAHEHPYLLTGLIALALLVICDVGEAWAKNWRQK